MRCPHTPRSRKLCTWHTGRLFWGMALAVIASCKPPATGGCILFRVVRTLLCLPNYPWGGGLGHHPVRLLAGTSLGPELLMYMGYRLFSGFGWGFTVNQHFLRSRTGTVMPMYGCCGFCATLLVRLPSRPSGRYRGGILPSSLQQNGVGVGLD